VLEVEESWRSGGGMLPWSRERRRGGDRSRREGAVTVGLCVMKKGERSRIPRE
jgi:hypothetical protein